MKIGTVTVHHAHNYGAMLQAYALQQELIELGYETELVDYDEINSKLFVKLNNKSIKDIISWIFYNLRTLIHYKEMKMAFNRFENFYEIYFYKSKKFNDYNDIDVSYLDMLLVGSDQVWCFKQGGNRPFFQLKFNNDIMKASYEASMGGFFCLSDEQKKDFSSSLQGFKRFSVRERETGEYIKNVIEDISYEVSLDPVFLLNRERWMNLSNDSFQYELPDKYILCYELIRGDGTKECIEKLKKKYDLPVVVLHANIYSAIKGDINIYDAGPLEMIYLINHSEVVVTSSFHGTVFSIVFDKPFYSILTKHGPGRISEMLNNMRLSDRIFKLGSDVNLDCDFKYSTKILDIEKEQSINYLRKLGEAEKCAE